MYKNGQAVDLNSLIAPGSGFTLDKAFDVNNAGEIVGAGHFDAHPDRSLGFTLTPTS